METFRLNNGIEMPKVGLGTFLIPPDEIGRTIAEAYDLGYRHFDTAWRYHNEKAIAKALKDNHINRNDVFITTKVNRDALYIGGYKVGKRSILNMPNFRTIKKVIKESFDNLSTDYIDLFLIHWPYPLPLSLRMYEELSRLYHDGRIRAIGVCSCLPPHIEAIKDVSDVMPAVNQFEISPLNTQKSLIKYCIENEIQPEAMSTFSHFRSNEPRPEILKNEHLLALSSKYEKSVAQIVLRWLIQQGVAVIPKTWDSVHLKENISIFDFSLNDDDMAIIDSLDKGKFLNYDPTRFLHTVPPKYRVQK